jgi:hypothetical protein
LATTTNRPIGRTWRFLDDSTGDPAKPSCWLVGASVDKTA